MSKGKHRPIRPSSNLPKNPTPTSSISEEISVTWKYADVGSGFCLSGCEAQEIKSALNAIRRITSMTWVMLMQSGGKQNKTGLHATKYEDGDLKHVTRPQAISKDLPMIGVRASGKFRIFGVRQDMRYHILWFDRNHDLCPA